jgi:hypothetical protein
MKVWVVMALNEYQYDGDSQWFDSVFTSLDALKNEFKDYRVDEESKYIYDKDNWEAFHFFEQEVDKRD